MTDPEPARNAAGSDPSPVSLQLKQSLEDLRLRRDKTRKKALTVSFALFAVILLGCLAFSATAGDPAEAAGMFIGAFITSIVLSCVPYYLMMRGVKLQYKMLVVPAMLKELDPGLAYDPGRFIQKEDFRQAKIFSQSIDSYKGEDLIHGTYRGIPIRFSELTVQEEHTDGKNNHTYHTFFHGVFLIADFNKHFQYRHWVLPDTAEAAFGQVFGNFLQKLHLPGRGHMTRLEDPAFEKKFVVYTEDDVEARYILTPKLMHTMVAMSDHFKKGVSKLAFAFLNSSVYIAIPIPNGRDLFEMPSHGEIGEAAARRTQEELREILRVFDVMDLDLRIWSKD